MAGLLPEIDPFTGIRTTYSWDHDKNELVWARTQDCTDILEANKANFNDPEVGWRKRDDKDVLLARIPNMIIEKWLVEEGINVFRAKMGRDGKPNDDMVRVLRKLRDPEWRYLLANPIACTFGL